MDDPTLSMFKYEQTDGLLFTLLFIICGLLFSSITETSRILVSGFEAGGPNTPSNIDPWSIIGNESSIYVETDRTSCFDRNKVALRLEVLCDSTGDNICPADGVGVYNPGFWGMVRRIDTLASLRS